MSGKFGGCPGGQCGKRESGWTKFRRGFSKFLGGMGGKIIKGVANVFGKPAQLIAGEVVDQAAEYINPDNEHGAKPRQTLDEQNSRIAAMGNFVRGQMFRPGIDSPAQAGPGTSTGNPPYAEEEEDNMMEPQSASLSANNYDHWEGPIARTPKPRGPIPPPAVMQRDEMDWEFPVVEGGRVYNLPKRDKYRIGGKAFGYRLLPQALLPQQRLGEMRAAQGSRAWERNGYKADFIDRWQGRRFLNTERGRDLGLNMRINRDLQQMF